MIGLSNFLKDESGATAVEYALIAAGIGAVVAAAVTALGGSITTAFDEVGCITEGKTWNDLSGTCS